MPKRSMVLITATILAATACGSDDTRGATDSSVPDGPIGGGPFAVADLTVEYTHPDLTLSYRISCQGDTANVTGDAAGVTAERACTALAQPDVAQRLIEGPPADEACTEIYGGPDVARIEGMLDNAPVQATVDRGNGCGINDWDVLLAAILPDAIGVTE